MQDTVLIVGAGPTGLVMALWLSKFNIPVRIIDKDTGPGQTSRAMGVQAHTLESYHQIGIADEVIKEGIVVKQGHVRKDGKAIANIELSTMGKNLSPYPYLLTYPQDDHEKLLIRHLQQAGIEVERNTQLMTFREENDAVVALLKNGNKTEEVKAVYLCGCDGASSTTRMQLKIGFPGGTYSQIFYVADVMATGDAANGDMQLCMNSTNFSLVLPVRRTGSYRVIGIVPPKKDKTSTMQFTDVLPSAKQITGLTITSENWFSTYHCHHRVAERFRQNRIFLLGDAAHIHSPAGGQGMNTGIGDAINLAWKMAAVLQNRAATALLDSYEIERMAFAKKLVSTTDKAFTLMTNEGLSGKVWRNVVVPYIFPILLRIQALKVILFKTISQIKINYRNSPITVPSSGKIQGGDRLPWVNYGDADNFKTLRLLDWQIHIYGQTQAEFKSAVQARGLELYEFPWNDKASDAGLQMNAFYLIRPDGYIALTQAQNPNALEAYLADNKIVTRKTATTSAGMLSGQIQ